MKHLKNTFYSFVIGVVALSLAGSSANAATCPNPQQPLGTAWCDQNESNFEGGVLCLAEPIDGPPTSSIDAESVGDGVCILGKFKTPSDIQDVVDFVVTYDYPADPLLGPSGILVPELQALSSTGEFLTTVPLQEEGIFDISIQGRVVNDSGSYQDINISRRILRVSKPHLTVSRARAGGASVDCSATDPNCFGVTEQQGDSDGDGICDGAQEIPGLCTAGPDTVDDNGTEGEPHAVQIATPSTPIRSVDLCVSTHDEGTEPGNSIRVQAVNTITDSSVTPAKEIMVDATCATEDSETCQIAGDSFCPNGFVVSVPVAHGSNKIELFVNNLATGYDVGAGQRIEVVPFDVDLKGPDLCVTYWNEDGKEIKNVAGRAILSSEADQVTVDVSLGACDGTPEEIKAKAPQDCDPNDSPACENAPVCIQRNSEFESENNPDAPRFVAMCEATLGGKTHYRTVFDRLRFPINTAKIIAKDDFGNQTVETASFGYGRIRPLFNAHGELNLQRAMIPNALGGFISNDFVTGKVKQVLLTALNSDKFKNELFPELLDPRLPSTEEIGCLKRLESKAKCSFDHLASQDRVVAIKPFYGDVEGYAGFHLGPIEIPSLYLLNQDRIRAQVKIKGMHGRAEMYTMYFIDSDHDGKVDTEDNDDDNDGICDKDREVSGECKLSETPPPARDNDCPLYDPKNHLEDDGKYSDHDDDNDGIPDECDLPGRLGADPDFGTPSNDPNYEIPTIIPLNFTVKELVLNLDIQFQKTRDGQLHLSISRADVPGRQLVEAIPDGKYLIDFQCEKNLSEIIGGGGSEDFFNGKRVQINRPLCNSLKNLNDVLSGNSDFLSNGFISLASWIGIVDREQRKQQTANQQLFCTLEAVAQCSVPNRIETQLDKLNQEKLTGMSVELLDNRFHLDLYAPLGTADISIDGRGIGFGGKGLLLPAGVTEPQDDAERDSVDFINTLPNDFKNPKFGPLSQADDEESIDPETAAFEMGQPLNLALNEEAINSALHSVGILLWDLARQEGDLHQTLDLNIKSIREDFNLGIPDIGTSICKDKDGNEVSNDSWECFPFPLNIENVLGANTLTYVDFDGNGVAGSKNDPLAPVTIRNNINPLSPPTVRIVDVTPIEGYNGRGRPTLAPVSILELEIGLNDLNMSLFEEKVKDWSATPIEGTGEIKSWCDNDRYPGANPALCEANKPMPMATFGVSGRVFVTVLMKVNELGIIKARGGLSSIERFNEDGSVAEDLQLDRTKTYLEFTVKENNTIVPDNELAAAFKGQIAIILEQYVFGNRRDVQLKLPLQLPLAAYCEKYAETDPDTCDCIADPDKDGCSLVNDIEDAWNDLDLDQFGIFGIRIDHPLLGVTTEDVGPTRYLTIGTDASFDLGNGIR